MQTEISGDVTITGTINECIILNDSSKKNISQMQQGGGVYKGIPVIKNDDLSMDVGNSIHFNNNGLDRTYSIRTSDTINTADKVVKQLGFENMLTLTNANTRESGIIFDIYSPGDVDISRISMYTDIQIDHDNDTAAIKPSRNTFEFAVADNGLNPVTDTSPSERIIARKYNTGRRTDATGKIYQRDQFAQITSEMALLDYDGKTKIGANNLIIGDLNVSKVLEAVISQLNLTRADFTDTPMYEDYRTATPLVTDDTGAIISSYRELEQAADSPTESSN